jgi:isocitrate/isopropylmalate dehydrogenase
LDLYANIRPARNYSGVPAMGVGIDLVVVRENTEGFYADRNMFQGSGEFMPSEDMALSIRKITRSSCERIARSACELALRRRQHLTVVHKANVLRVSDGLFKTVVLGVASQYPELQIDEMLIDAMAAALIRRPQDFDVIVTSNMYGDILSDVAVELTGGLGLGGALNVGDEHAIAQATHGSAPDIGGRNLANPTALLLSTAMLLCWLGGRHNNEALGKASDALESALSQVLENPAEHTADLGGPLGTEEFGNAVLAHL